MRAVIAEDLALLRDGLARILRAHDIDVAAAVGDPVALAAALEEQQPDIAIVDVRMPPTFTNEGLVAAIEARARRPGLPVLVLSQYVEQLYARELMLSGAESVGYLLKDRVSDFQRFTDAVRRVAEGGSALDPEVVSEMLRRRRAVDPLAVLTPREREVLALMAEGRSNQAISQVLVVSERAVEKHVTSIFAKLDLPQAAETHRRVLAVLAFLHT